MKKYKVAVCLSGQSRTFDYCKDSILEYYDGCDFFCHTWDRNSYHEHGVPIVMGNWDKSILNRIEDSLKPKLFTCSNFKDTLVEYKKMGWKYSENELNNISMWYSQAKSYDYDFSDYDFVVKSRYDFIHNPDKNIHNVCDTISKVTGIPDDPYHPTRKGYLIDDEFKMHDEQYDIINLENLSKDRFIATDMFSDSWVKKYKKYGKAIINQSFTTEEFFSHNEADYLTDSVTANRIRKFSPVTRRNRGIVASLNVDFLNYIVSDGTSPIWIPQWWNPIRPRFTIMEKDWRKLYDRYSQILKDDCYETGIPPTKEYFKKYMKPGDLITENALEYKKDE